MSEGPLAKFVILSVIVVCACAPANTIAPPVADRCSSEAKGNAELHAPIVCVGMSEGKITVDPPVIKSWDTLPKSNAKGVVHWITQNPHSTLKINMKDKGCVDEPVDCKKGHCKATAREVSDVEKKRQCAYGITLDDKVLDPDVIIVSCCQDETQP